MKVQNITSIKRINGIINLNPLKGKDFYLIKKHPIKMVAAIKTPQ